MMSEEKQIEEMAEDLETAKVNALATIGSMNDGFGAWYAKALYNAGYRKQSEGEWAEKNVFFAIYKCSICGEENLYKDGHACLSKFCPNCGAKMGGGAE